MKSAYLGFIIFLAWVIGWSIFATPARASEYSSAQFLMVDQHGNIMPPGFAAGLDDIARESAKAEANRQAAELYASTTAAASNIVAEVVAALTGAYGFAYVTGHTVSLSAGSVEISTNATVSIVYCQFGDGGTLTTNGVPYTGHYIWHVFSEGVNSAPAVKYKTNLDATNVWRYADLQSTAEFQNTTVNGTAYDVIYRSTVWLPSSLSSAFFMAFCEAVGQGSVGSVLVVEGGFSINGKVGYTGTDVRNGKVYTYDSGALMSVTNEVQQ